MLFYLLPIPQIGKINLQAHSMSVEGDQADSQALTPGLRLFPLSGEQADLGPKAAGPGGSEGLATGQSGGGMKSQGVGSQGVGELHSQGIRVGKAPGGTPTSNILHPLHSRHSLHLPPDSLPCANRMLWKFKLRGEAFSCPRASRAPGWRFLWNLADSNSPGRWLGEPTGAK